jgi:hypothetical protein
MRKNFFEDIQDVEVTTRPLNIFFFCKIKQSSGATLMSIINETPRDGPNDPVQGMARANYSRRPDTVQDGVPA